MALLINLQSQSELQEKLSKDDKQVILKLAAEHLGGIKEADLQEALDSLKSLRDKFKDFWNEWLPAIGVSIQTVLALLKPIANLGGISELAKFQAPEFRGTDSLKYQLKLVVDLSRKLGWKSIYVLVDRVDESALTGNNPKASYELLEPLLRDLQLLEFPGLGFKFFLWDQLQPLCDPVLRKDRIKVDVLDWDDAMLLRLWEKRLEAFSAGTIRSLEEISERTKPYMVDDLVYIFAQHSPRDMIRIGERILSEQQEFGSMEEGISEQAIYSGIEKFCEDRVTEVITRARVLQELKKVRQVDFTIPYLANEVFREQHASTRQRMIAWREEAAIIEIERIDDPNSKQQRKVKLFALKDIRVAKAIYPELTIPEFLHRKYKRCPNCSASVIRDWGEVDSSATCHDCQFDLGSDAVDNVQDSMRKAIAAARRREYREETLDVEAIQLSLLDSEEFST
jgi:hypothetical protein